MLVPIYNGSDDGNGAVSFPVWIKASIGVSIFFIVLSFLSSVFYFFGANLSMTPVLLLLLAGLAMFAFGLSLARQYDKRHH